MADRLISADALQEWVRNYLSVFKKYDWRDILQIIRNQPVVDAEPVRHGRWMHLSNTWGECSVCGERNKYLKRWNYCPNCGAKMDGERREDG